VRCPFLLVVRSCDDRTMICGFWVSDEYGPYIYRFSSSGKMLQVIQTPLATVPLDASGTLNFTATPNPATGRTP
jgi:hypothetical protein